MKLVTTATALVAALSLFGCATENDGEGGGFTAGLRPAKPSLEDITSSPAQPSGAIEQLLNGTVRNPRGSDFLADPEISSETLKPPFPIRGVCEICDVVVLRDTRKPGEFTVVDDDGGYFCRYWVDNGQITDNGCR
jgi:hypothetical protein